MQLLDPKNDIVFKLLFAHPDHRDILISLLTAVLSPPVPIADATVLNPEVRKDLPGDKSALLDIHVRLADGRHVDVEMQAAAHPGLVERILFYWAKLYGAQLTAGEDYGQLRPCIGIMFLNARLLPTGRFHGTFRVLEIRNHFELTDGLELHLIELPKLDAEGEDPRLARWVRFLSASSEAEIEELAMSDSDMRRAKDALNELSQDTIARELARERELSRASWAIIRFYERKEGKDEGLREGRAEGLREGLREGHAEGHAEGLRVAITTLCDVLGIEVTPERQRRIASENADGLAALLNQIRTDKVWSDEQ